MGTTSPFPRSRGSECAWRWALFGGLVALIGSATTTTTAVAAATGTAGLAFGWCACAFGGSLVCRRLRAWCTGLLGSARATSSPENSAFAEVCGR